MLTPGEVDDFFGVVRSLVDQGKSIIFITHKLREVLAVADRITVLRNGKVAGTADPKTATQQSLANLMVGRDVVFQVEKGPSHPVDTVIRVNGLGVDDDRGVRMVNDLSLEVRAGEIFGVAGVEGNGQRELVEAVTGMRPKEAGRVEILGVDATKLSPAQDHRTRHRPHPRGPQQARPGRPVLDRRQPGAQPLLPSAVLPTGDPQHVCHRRGGRAVGRSVRHPDAGHRRADRQPVRRQPAEGDRRPRTDRRREGDLRRPADQRPRRRLDRVHPQADHRPARRRCRRAAGLGRARRDPVALRPDRRALSRAAGRHVRRGGNDTGATWAT